MPICQASIYKMIPMMREWLSNYTYYAEYISKINYHLSTCDDVLIFFLTTGGRRFESRAPLTFWIFVRSWKMKLKELKRGFTRFLVTCSLKAIKTIIFGL